MYSRMVYYCLINMISYTQLKKLWKGKHLLISLLITLFWENGELHMSSLMKIHFYWRDVGMDNFLWWERLILPFSFVLHMFQQCCKIPSFDCGPWCGITYEDSSIWCIRWLSVDNQSTLGELRGEEEDLLSCHKYDTFLLKRFDQVFLNHVPWE